MKNYSHKDHAQIALQVASPSMQVAKINESKSLMLHGWRILTTKQRSQFTMNKIKNVSRRQTQTVSISVLSSLREYYTVSVYSLHEYG